MLKFYDASREAHPLSAYKNLLLTHKLNGYDKLSFSVPVEDDLYPMIAEECQVDYDDNEWLIKKINDAKIECELNFDFLKSRIYKSYNSGSRTLTEALLAHLPDGWVFEGANTVSISRTISFDFCTDYDVVMQCMETYGVYFVWHIKSKKVTVYNPEAMVASGEYFTDELNLKDLSFKGNTTEFITRLYCYGKDGLTFSDINNGNEYIDNNTYSNKIVCGYFNDDRFTDKQSLLSAGTETLATLAYPVRSYECDVVDLAKLNSDYSFLDIKMHKIVTLIDRKRNIKINHRIVEYKEYPDNPEDNIVTLSSVPGTIQSSVKSIKSSLTEDIKTSNNSMLSRITMATAMMTGVFGGYVVNNGSEVLLMDNVDSSLAEVVWKWNINGFAKSSTGINGPYTTALTFDDTFITNIINAMVIRGSLIEANSIQSGSISQTYKSEVTDEINEKSIETEQLFNAANGQLMSRISEQETALSIETDTREAEISEIKQTAGDLSLSFSNRYTGGINYIKNSSGLNGVSNDWTYTGIVNALQNSDTKNKTSSNSCFEIKSASTLVQSVDNVISGSYTLTFKYKKTSVLSASVKLVHDGIETDVINISNTINNWTEHITTVDNVVGELSILIFSSGDSFYVSDLMLVEGTTKAKWAPAPDELYTTNVKFDRNGISVINSESDTRTVINNTEFAIYHGDSKVITVNKDETQMKKTVIDSDLTIGKVKFLPLANRSDGLDIILLD